MNDQRYETCAYPGCSRAAVYLFTPDIPNADQGRLYVCDDPAHCCLGLTEPGWSGRNCKRWIVEYVDLVPAASPAPALAPNGFRRRACMDEWTPAERAIWDAKQEVEKAGAHVWLTDAVILLDRAQAKVADFVELPAPSAQTEISAGKTLLRPVAGLGRALRVAHGPAAEGLRLMLLRCAPEAG